MLTGNLTWVCSCYPGCAGGGLITPTSSGGWYVPATANGSDATTVTIGSVGCNEFLENICMSGTQRPSGALPAEPQMLTVSYVGPQRNTSMGDEWFYVEDMAGSAGYSSTAKCNNNQACAAQAGAGAGAVCANGSAGVLGGGSVVCIGCIPQSSLAGCAGGSGAPQGTGSVPGTPGMVIIYW
jgi:hypothetical protein